MMANKLFQCTWAKQMLKGKSQQNLVSATVEMGKLCSKGSENKGASSCWGPQSQLIRLTRVFIEHLLCVVLFIYQTGKTKPPPISQSKEGGWRFMEVSN